MTIATTAARGALGIDIGASKTLLALFNEKFQILDEIKIKTPGKKEFDGALETAVGALARKAKHRGLTLLGVGLGCAGTFDLNGEMVAGSGNIPFIGEYPFRTRLSKLAGASVIMGNDVQMGLYGEHRLGAAKGLRHVLAVFFGTGVGAALIIDGDLYLGASGAAGEFGHCLVAPMGPLTGSERQGVLDDFVGRHAIAGAAASISARRLAPRLYERAGADVTRIRSGVLADSIRKGDTNIEEMVRSRARTAGIALSNLVDFLSPEMVVLGGGLVEAMPSLFKQEITQEILAHTVPAVAKTVRVVVAKLGRHAVTAGAAKMAWDRLVPDSTPLRRKSHE